MEVFKIAKYNIDYDIRAPTDGRIFIYRNKSVQEKVIYFTVKAGTGGEIP